MAKRRSDRGKKPQYRKPQRTGRGTKDQRRDEEIVDTGLRQERSRSNPFDWYSKNMQFTMDAGNLPFSTPLGALIMGSDADPIVIPGVLAMHFIPTIGYSNGLQSPFNRQIIRFRTFLRSIQRASEVYDAADVGMYVMSMDSAYMYWALMRRAYKVALLYTPMNRYYPRQLLAAMGFDPSIADNLAEFRMYINKFALSLSAFAMPEDFDINARHMWMCEGLYLDSESSRSQTYLFVPECFWMYNNTVETGSQLEPIWWQNQSTLSTPTLHDMASVKQIGTQLIQAFQNDSDTALISGDIYRAYNGRVRKLPETAELEQVVPIYDKTVLSQIENATICGAPVISSMKITQDPTINGGAILFQPSFRPGYAYRSSDGNSRSIAASWKATSRLINFHHDSPTPQEVIEATRLTCSSHTLVPEGTIVPTPIDVFPADIPTSMYMFRFNPATYPAFNALYVGVNDIVFTYTDPADTIRRVDRGAMSFESMITNFDWHPIMGIYEVNMANENLPADDDLLYYCGDIDNCAIVDISQLERMHEAAMWSLFTLPDPDHVAVMG